MREFFLAGQSGVGPKIDDHDFAFELFNNVFEAVVLDNLDFHFSRFNLVGSRRQPDTEKDQGQKAQAIGTPPS
jgi:hypothetical protein